MKENPKLIQARKEGKPPLEYLVKTTWEEDARVHKHGADKYGKNNWRIDKILTSTYEAAILRHYKAYFVDGEDIDPDSGESHLTHIRACCAVMRDAEMHGTLIDDRNTKESLNDREAGHPVFTEHHSGSAAAHRGYSAGAGDSGAAGSGQDRNGPGRGGAW